MILLLFIIILIIIIININNVNICITCRFNSYVILRMQIRTRIRILSNSIYNVDFIYRCNFVYNANFTYEFYSYVIFVANLEIF